MKSMQNKLKSKHPCPGRVLCFPDSPLLGSESLVVNEKQVLEAVFSFPNGTSAGIDGMRTQHLIIMVMLV